MARRRHPYFSRINRLAAAKAVEPGVLGPRRVREPKLTPHEEPGILWETLRTPGDATTEAE